MNNILNTNIFPRSLERSEKTVILDLDETVANTKSSETSVLDFQKLNLQDPKNMELREHIYCFNVKSGDNNVPIWGVVRPGAQNFLKFLRSYSKYLIVWSAGKPEYVKKLCNYLFRDIEGPDLILDSEDCEEIEKDGKKVKCLKRLSRIFEDPRYKDDIKKEKTLVIDDNSYTFHYNEENAIHIPCYEINPTMEDLLKEEKSLEKLMNWLVSGEVFYSKDVTKLNKSNIFS